MKMDKIKNHLNPLAYCIITRNYPTDLIEKQFTRAKEKDRKTLIFQNRKKKNQKDDKIRLMFTKPTPHCTSGLESVSTCYLGTKKQNQLVTGFKSLPGNPKTYRG